MCHKCIDKTTQLALTDLRYPAYIFDIWLVRTKLGPGVGHENPKKYLLNQVKMIYSNVCIKSEKKKLNKKSRLTL